MRDFLFAAAAVALLGSPAAALTVTNGGADVINSWGGSSTQKYGQTFVAGPENVLESITFNIDDHGAAIDFKAYVFSWDAGTTRATGPALFESATMATAGVSGYTPVTASTGGVSLTEGEDYVAFFFASSGSGAFWFGNSDPNSYADGDFVFQNNGSLAGATDQAWSFYSVQDTAFTLEFSGDAPTVPVPAALPMLLSGIGALGFAARRRKSKA